jgi:hypothetical protein
MTGSANHISDFSPHLFWDFDRSQLSETVLSAQLVQRVMEYGVLSDWLILLRKYGMDSIIRVAQGIRSLDPVSLAFLSSLSGIPKENFRCYSTKPLTPQHWNF